MLRENISSNWIIGSELGAVWQPAVIGNVRLAWLPRSENCPEWKFQFNLVRHSWPLMISMKFITLRLFAKLGTLSNVVYLCPSLGSHIIYPLMSFWSYPIKSSWESNDQQNMETQTHKLKEEEEDERKWRTLYNNFIQTPVPACVCVQMCNHNNDGRPNYSHHSQFLSHTYKTKQNAFNCICWSWEQYHCELERADEPHPHVSSDIIYTDNIYRSRGEEIPHYDSTCKCCNFPNVYQL